MEDRTLTQKLLAEFVGTFALCFIGIGAVASAADRGSPGDIVPIAFAHGLAIAVMVSAMGHISGGHFNPAVTIGAWVTQKIESRDAMTYIGAQLAGGAAGAGLLRVLLPSSIWEKMQLGVPTINSSLTNGQGLLIEAVLTFLLVWVIFATAVDPEGAFGKIAGLAIGLTVTMDILMGGGFTGAAMNPARHFGPALAGGYWGDWWIWWFGPIAGGVVAASLYDALILSRRGTSGPAVGDEPHAPHGWGAHGEDGDATVSSS